MTPSAPCEISKGLGSGRRMVARLKLEGIDGKSPSGAEPAACEPAACERPMVVCVGGRGGGGGTGVCIDRVSVCTFKTTPCVPAPRPHVSYMWAWCRYTRGRFECTHGCFHMFFTVPHHTTPHTPITHHDHQRHHDHITQHGDRNRERQRKRDKKREDETRQEGKRREEKR